MEENIHNTIIIDDDKKIKSNENEENEDIFEKIFDEIKDNFKSVDEEKENESKETTNEEKKDEKKDEKKEEKKEEKNEKEYKATGLKDSSFEVIDEKDIYDGKNAAIDDDDKDDF